MLTNTNNNSRELLRDGRRRLVIIFLVSCCCAMATGRKNSIYTTRAIEFPDASSFGLVSRDDCPSHVTLDWRPCTMALSPMKGIEKVAVEKRDFER